MIVVQNNNLKFLYLVRGNPLGSRLKRPVIFVQKL